MTCGTGGAGRFAPSPSGDLHLGNLRTALLAWLFARSTERRFLIRIEDVDAERSRDPRGQLDDLVALGLDWDGDPVVQSERRSRHTAVLADLESRGLTYPCFCTRREIREAPRAPHQPVGSYPGTCRDLTPTQRSAREARLGESGGRRPAVRLRADADRLVVDDLLHGAVEGVVDDFVLQRGDGAFAYNLVVVVDDADAGVDQVVRGDDLLETTARQVRLQQLLGAPTPTYAHVPLALNAAGARLSKRDGAVTLRESGLTPAAVLTLLAGSLGLAAPGEQVTMPMLLDRFDPARLPRSPWIVDLAAE